MIIDIIDLTDEQFADLNAVQMAMVRAAQTEKNDILAEAEEQKGEIFRRLLTNGTARSSYYDDRAEAIDEEALRRHISEAVIEFRTNAEGRSETYLNGENVEREIRSLEVANGASRVSTLGFVRRELVRRQQEMGRGKGIVMDGRDIGTVVFPQAELKLFVTASPEVRARRRMLELQAKGEAVSYDEVLANVVERDRRDTQRAESPLRKAADAVEIDNSRLSREEQREIVRKLFNQLTVDN